MIAEPVAAMMAAGGPALPRRLGGDGRQVPGLRQSLGRTVFGKESFESMNPFPWILKCVCLDMRNLQMTSFDIELNCYILLMGFRF